MNNLVEATVLYLTTFTDILQKLLGTAINYGLNITGVSFGTVSELTSSIAKPKDQLGLNFFEFYKQLIDLLIFDSFQILLIKIFLLTLLTILIMIYAAWYVYGSRISDRFMYSEIVMKDKHNGRKND